MSDPAGAAHREPLLSSRFTLTLDGVTVAGVLRVSALDLPAPGSAPAPVVVVRAAGTDDVLGAWARDALGGAEAAARDLVLTLVDAAGAPALGWHLVGATPVGYSPLGELDASAEQVVTETLTLAITGIRPV